MIAKVVVDNRSRHTDKIFDYIVPEEIEKTINIGSRVLVPFSGANKEIEGFCVGFSQESEAKRLKEIIKLANDTNAFDEEMLEVIEYMHNKYLAPYIDIIHSIVPSGTSLKSEEWIVIDNITPQRSTNRERIIQILFENGGAIMSSVLYSMFQTDIRASVRDMIKKGVLKREYRSSYDVGEKKIRAVRLKINTDEAMCIAENIEKKAPVQARMIEILCVNDFIAASDLARFAQGSASAVSALCNKNIAEIFEIEVVRDAFLKKQTLKSEAKIPTTEQATAIFEINKAIDEDGKIPHLLYGVTGSGKTEVFMQCIDHAIQKGKTAVVLVPEISLTSQMVSRFVSRFGSEVAVFHSRLSQGERYDQWKRIKNGDAKIVVGARSAIFAPLKDIGIIIMDEEHSDTYKSEMSPRYHARDIAYLRAKQNNALLLFASATPSVESFYYAKMGKYKLLTMHNRYNHNELPDITITDMRDELRLGNRSMFSKKLIAEIEKNIANGEQT
ncbi:MAG: primosomal protein N', partial [Clostridia bacterium]|nr:primosomal protein N' [Clostridia bacterium]